MNQSEGPYRARAFSRPVATFVATRGYGVLVTLLLSNEKPRRSGAFIQRAREDSNL
jgi:hypothetical protein